LIESCASLSVSLPENVGKPKYIENYLESWGKPIHLVSRNFDDSLPVQKDKTSPFANMDLEWERKKKVALRRRCLASRIFG